jgi:hypothetical protein
VLATFCADEVYVVPTLDEVAGFDAGTGVGVVFVADVGTGEGVGAGLVAVVGAGVGDALGELTAFWASDRVVVEAIVPPFLRASSAA